MWNGLADLALIAHAAESSRPFAWRSPGAGSSNAARNRDDGNHHQQLDQCKGLALVTLLSMK